MDETGAVAICRDNAKLVCFVFHFNYERILNCQTLHFGAIMNRLEPVNKKLLVQLHGSTVYLKRFGKITRLFPVYAYIQTPNFKGVEMFTPILHTGYIHMVGAVS
jgi:hypothetical protein